MQIQLVFKERLTFGTPVLVNVYPRLSNGTNYTQTAKVPSLEEGEG